jgi:molybdenum cofactor biosynthesis enzyme MoaA
VKSAGLPIEQIDPTVLQVLHVEPSFLCHLSCPLCIPQKQRKSIKSPPYHLTVAMYEGFLKQLRKEGIRQIKLAIFEGRGDPLSCPDMEALIEITKSYYPTANTCITTHGSFPYKEWVVASKLDVIRFSVDGARQENYQKYRIGGKLDKIFTFMEGIQRDRSPQSKLYVEWKYILFEWNDEEDELAEAAAIARKFGVQLRFCRTHSAGRSMKYKTAQQITEMIRRCAPGALQDLTFQLKEDGDFAQVNVVRDDQIRSLLRHAIEQGQEGKEAAACMAALEALELDGGMQDLPHSLSYASLEQISLEQPDAIRLPFVAELLAQLFKAIDRCLTVPTLLKRCAVLTEDDETRRHVEIEAVVEGALYAERHGEHDQACQQLRELLAPGTPPGELLNLLGPALSAKHTGLSAAMANMLKRDNHLPAAALLFEQYLALAPYCGDWEDVARHVSEMRRDILLSMAHARSQSGRSDAARSLLAEAIAIDNHLANGAPSFEDLVSDTRKDLMEHVGTIAVGAQDFKAAYLAERKMRLG